MESFKIIPERSTKRLLELVKQTQKPINKIAENALRHIDMAEKIKNIDPNMAALRMITAEEEAARAIILSLQSIKYAGADRLKPRDHVHKFGIFPFLSAIKLAFKDFGDKFKVRIVIMEFMGKEIVRLGLTKIDGNKDEVIFSVPPLEFSISSGTTSKPYDFEEGLKLFAARKNVKGIKTFIELEAKFRQVLLYATDEGIAQINSSDKVFELRKNRAIIMVCIYLMIEPYSEKQSFVQNCLLQYLKILDILPEDLKSEF